MKLFLLLLSFSLAVVADVTPMPVEFEMPEPQYTLNEKTYSVAEVIRGEVPTLIGGVVANPSEFPASVWAGNCTSTVIGERVLLIAAHCVSNGGTKQFVVGPTRYSAKCAHHPSYKSNSTADWAICLVDKPVEGIPYEKIATSGTYQVGEKILLMGYGCTKAGGGGGIDGKLRMGDGKVSRLPSGTNYDTITNSGAALCFGDSGGPAFDVEENGERSVISVNSRGNISTTSFLSSVWVQTAQDWLKSWASSNGVKICGIHSDAVGCRGAKPPGPVTFVVENKTVKFEVVWQPTAPYTLEETKAAAKQVADYLETK